MEQDFYRERLEQQGLTVIVPPTEEREIVHRIIYEELCLGKVLPESRAAYQTIMDKLARQGAQAIILGWAWFKPG
jgi:aspartate racemase